MDILWYEKPLELQKPFNGSIESIQGKRSTHLDRSFICKFSENVILYGILDGHHDETLVDIVKERLPLRLLENLKLSPENVEKSIKYTFKNLDREIYDELPKNSDNTTCNKSGTTSTLILRIVDTVYIVNLGDSRAYFSTPHFIIQTIDNKASIETERIRSVGGIVFRNLCASYPFSRILGCYVPGSKMVCGEDFNIDNPLSYYKYEAPISCEPVIIKQHITPGIRTIICLVSKGVFNTPESQTEINVLLSKYTNKQCKDPQKLANKILKNSKGFAKYRDNATVLIESFN